jgi:hypothetical protein
VGSGTSLSPVSFPLFDVIPICERSVSRVALGDFPTPVESLDTVSRELGASDGQAWVKRDDISSPAYGGNKVRTLELLFGEARALGREHVVSTGAFGSNHALATAIHAPRVGLRPGALLFPQPISAAALGNLRELTASSATLYSLPHWSALPFGLAWLRLRSGPAPYVMVPGGATPLGALGYVSAALELGRQVAAPNRDRGRGFDLYFRGAFVGVCSGRALRRGLRAEHVAPADLGASDPLANHESTAHRGARGARVAFAARAQRRRGAPIRPRCARRSLRGGWSLFGTGLR